MATPGSLPPGIPPKPKPNGFEKPVAWLFGRQFLAALKWILVYTAFKLAKEGAEDEDEYDTVGGLGSHSEQSVGRQRRHG